MPDLWPAELVAGKVRAPVALLHEQAALLGDKTGNVVQARVVPVEQFVFVKRQYEPFTYSFLLHAPALGSYRYRLFDITYGVALYPVRVFPDNDIVKELAAQHNVVVDKDAFFRAEDESKLMEYLSTIFHSEKTMQVIRALLAQSSVLADTGYAT